MDDPDAEQPSRPPLPMSRGIERLLVVGVVVGIMLVVVPFLTAAIGIATASRVPEGLRGATHRPEMTGKVLFAFRSTSILALAAPPGVLLFVSCGLALASERKRRADAARRDAKSPAGE